MYGVTRKSCLKILFSPYVALCNSLKVLRQVLHQDFLCSEIVLNLNFCIIAQVVHSKLSTWLYLNILTFHFKIPTNFLLQLQPNNYHFMASTHSFKAIKLTGFQKTIMRLIIHVYLQYIKKHLICNQPWKAWGWSLNFWASSETLTLIITL